jgi:hypothetical protein
MYIRLHMPHLDDLRRMSETKASLFKGVNILQGRRGGRDRHVPGSGKSSFLVNRWWAFILIHADMASHQEKMQDKDYVSPIFIDARDPDDTTSYLNTTGKVTEVIDCRETAPAAAATKMFKGKAQDASTWGGLAIAVPRELRGLELAHSRHGVLAWSKVVEPAMELAGDSVRVGPHLAGDIPGYWNQNDGLLSVLTKQNNKMTMLEECDTMTQPTLAATLEAVMTNGADAIYKGYRAGHLAHDIHQAGGTVS